MKNVEKRDDCNSVSGRWTKDEHKKFMEAISMFGKNWKKVEMFV